jgi:hypothetical protein
MLHRLLILIICFSISACSKFSQGSTAVDTDGGPTEATLRDFMFRQYEQIEARGGLPMTVTATGKSGIVHMKLYEVRKDECVKAKARPDGVYECGVNLMATMWWEGQREPKKPLQDAKRVLAIRDAKGVWIDCTYSNDRKSICALGTK